MKKNAKKTFNKRDFAISFIICGVVVLTIMIMLVHIYGGKRIVCTRSITNDKATIQTAYTFKFKNNKLDRIKGNVIIDYSKDEELSQKDFDEIVNKINNKDKYENVHINKFNKKATIDYDLKIEAAEFGDDLSFNAIFNNVDNDTSLGNCIIKKY